MKNIDGITGLIELLNRTIAETTMDSGSFAGFMDFAVNGLDHRMFEELGFGNLLLLYAQNPKARFAATADEWNKQDIPIRTGAAAAVLFRSITTKETMAVYDISQTEYVPPMGTTDTDIARSHPVSVQRENLLAAGAALESRYRRDARILDRMVSVPTSRFDGFFSLQGQTWIIGNCLLPADRNYGNYGHDGNGYGCPEPET